MKRILSARFIWGIVAGWLLCSVSGGDVGRLVTIAISAVQGIARSF